MIKTTPGLFIDYQRDHFVATVGQMANGRIHPAFPTTCRLMSDTYSDLMAKVCKHAPQAKTYNTVFSPTANKAECIENLADKYSEQFPRVNKDTHRALIETGERLNGWGLLGMICLYSHLGEGMTQAIADDWLTDHKEYAEVVRGVSDK